MPRVAIVAFDQFTDIDLVIAWDLLRRVPALDVRILAATARITSSTGLALDVHGPLAEAADADGVYIVSGAGTRALLRDSAWLGALRLDPARQVIAAVDSGAIILAALGFLRGKRATTYPADDLHATLASFGVERVDRALVVEGNIATAAQCLAGVDLVGWLVTRLTGAADAEAAIASVRPLGARPAPSRLVPVTLEGDTVDPAAARSGRRPRGAARGLLGRGVPARRPRGRRLRSRRAHLALHARWTVRRRRRARRLPRRHRRRARHAGPVRRRSRHRPPGRRRLLPRRSPRRPQGRARLDLVRPDRPGHRRQPRGHPADARPRVRARLPARRVEVQRAPTSARATPPARWASPTRAPRTPT